MAQKNILPLKELIEKNNQITSSDDKIFQVEPHSHIFENTHGNGLGSINRLILQGSAHIQNCRRKGVHPVHLSPPSMFPPTVKAEHLTAFHNACRKKQATVMVMGDSIFATASDMICHTENATYAWLETLQQQIPGVRFSFINAAAGGRSWKDMNSQSTPAPEWIDPPQGMNWKQAVRHYQPDLLLLHSGGNDVGNFNPVDVKELVGFFLETDTPPSIILGLTHHPSQASTINGYGTQEYQEGLDGIVKWLRTYAQREGLGYLDFHRWHSMRRDGFDPCELVLTRVYPEEGSGLSSFGAYVSEEPHNGWVFPACENEQQIAANNCTDFALAFELEKKPAFVSFNLSSGSSNAFYSPYSNKLHIFFDDDTGYISYSWSDGTHSDEGNKKITNISVPSFPALFNIMLKGSRLVFSVWNPLSHTNWQPGHLNMLGTGYKYIFDETIVRFGGGFTPNIDWSGYNRIRIFNLCIANSSVINGNTLRNMPDCIDNDLYEQTYCAGGSGHYHMNAYGVRDILTPIFRFQNWNFSV
ncbi:SGNH/GDSL hydrolase family protein [Acetobacter malorum]|uniref:SGNH/GDSL hydrolase family protein n=1 Tax=Acetobacter malorum TaxID=178901 RepID=UPI0009ED6D16|nr:SGNH/GDSL hydrolase family protein [Acetobacter malorum]